MSYLKSISVQYFHLEELIYYMIEVVFDEQYLLVSEVFMKFEN